MADRKFPSEEDLRNPLYVMPLEYGAPQDRGESAPQANPSPGPGNETEPRTDLKEFVVASGEEALFERHSPKPQSAPGSKAGGTEAQKK